MAPKIARLREMALKDLESQYDEMAGNVQVGLSFILDEIVRRERTTIDRRMLRLTWVVVVFSGVAALATIVALFR